MLPQEIDAIKKNQEVLEAKAKMRKASDEKMNEAREKFVTLRKGKQDLVSCFDGAWTKALCY